MPSGNKPVHEPLLSRYMLSYSVSGLHWILKCTVLYIYIMRRCVTFRYISPFFSLSHFITLYCILLHYPVVFCCAAFAVLLSFWTILVAVVLCLIPCPSRACSMSVNHQCCTWVVCPGGEGYGIKFLLQSFFHNHRNTFYLLLNVFIFELALPQLSCGDTRQPWIWFNGFNR